jgi:hypothetical protein
MCVSGRRKLINDQFSDGAQREDNDGRSRACSHTDHLGIDLLRLRATL